MKIKEKSHHPSIALLVFQLLALNFNRSYSNRTVKAKQSKAKQTPKHSGLLQLPIEREQAESEIKKARNMKQNVTIDDCLLKTFSLFS